MSRLAVLLLACVASNAGLGASAGRVSHSENLEAFSK